MNRSFTALLVSQIATNLGFTLYTMMIIMHLYNLTGSTSISATVTLISVIARIVSNVILPALSDRFHSRKLLISSQLFQLVFFGVLIFLISREFSTINMILILMTISIVSFFNGWFTPIKTAVVKAIVTKDLRVKANSLLSMVDQTFMFAGWTFGGLLLSLIGSKSTIVLTSSLLLVSMASLLLMRIPQEMDVSSKDSLGKQLTIGWQYLFKHKGLKTLITMDILEGLVGTIWIGAMILTYVKEGLGVGEEWWGYINGAYFLGTVGGGMIVYRLSKYMWKRTLLFMLVGAAAFGILTFMFGFMSNPFLVLLIVLLMGPTAQVRDLMQETTLQNMSLGSDLTKILAARAALSQVVFIISLVGIGILTDLMGVRIIYIVSGILLVASAFYGYVQLFLLGRNEFFASQYENRLRRIK